MPDLSTLITLAVIAFLVFVALLVVGLCAAAGRQMPSPPVTTRPTSSNRKSGRTSR